MTSHELAAELGLKETYLRNHWTRIKDNHMKIGIRLFKVGRGDKANYGIMSYGDERPRWQPRGEKPASK